MFLRVILLLLLVSTSASAQPRGAFDILHYRVSLTIPPHGSEISVRSVISLKATERLSTVNLDLTGMTVDAIEHEGVPARFERNGSTLEIQLTEPLEPYRVTSVAIRYHGVPSDGLIIQQTKHGDRSIFADNWPDRARHWLVSRDHPSDKATVEFLVEAPAELTVVANGRIEGMSTHAAMKRWHFFEDTPIPVHCMVIGATRFSVINAGKAAGTDILYYIYPKDAEAAQRQFGRASAMVEFFASRVGPYPYEKLAIVQSSTRFGGMENAGAIFLAEKPIGGTQSLERLVAHEIAHQWFGDSVTQQRWHDLWLSEGFATYYSALFSEHFDGRAAFLNQMDAARVRYLSAYRQDPRPIFDPSIMKLTDLLSRNNYDKGAWVLHMLRRVMGDEKFHRGVADYYAAYRDGNASTDDFRDVMERRAGVDLDWFFAQWIYGPGYPLLASTHEWSAETKRVKVNVVQKQEGAPFRMPLDVAIATERGTKKFVIDVDEKSESAIFELDGPPLSVTLDPDQWLLKE